MQDFDPYDIEGADLLSVGCAEHEDPSCLCDVDLSRGRAGEADLSLLKCWHGSPRAFMDERLCAAERRWFLDRFAPGLLDFLESLYSRRRETYERDGQDIVNRTLTYDGPRVLDYVVSAYGPRREPGEGLVQDHASESAGINRFVGQQWSYEIAQTNGTRNNLLKSYCLYMWDRAPEGVSRAAIHRELQKLAPELKLYTAYRWIYDHENGSRRVAS